jgi:hypothetical protein
VKTTFPKMWRGSRKSLLVLVALGGTLGAVHAAPVRNTDTSQVAMVAATQPSVASFIGVGGLSLIGMLTLRRRVRQAR